MDRIGKVDNCSARSRGSTSNMKFLTTNFLKCSVKGCDNSNLNFPLHYVGANCQLEQDESIEFNPEFLLRIIDRLEWPAVVSVAADLGNNDLPPNKPEFDENLTEEDMVILRDLHTLLIQTNITEGQMQCKNCEHIYYIKNSIPNLLLPPHLA
ncbi:unnamed protein product [Kluyveromyces dobzhanskii CBS 2104]|uniref:Multifunctional methyltransferase subunit trm112 n=1 Tax=Kluyveromyces dobzhanskii CBS 2104 TaxID=1427455 RepID=A0A0A8L3B9_9SACH|nr:unnamed protein product [Kluyveromyces dobzhanskii CBS 2104]